MAQEKGQKSVSGKPVFKCSIGPLFLYNHRVHRHGTRGSDVIEQCLLLDDLRAADEFTAARMKINRNVW